MNKLHHFGFLTKNIAEAIKKHEILGFRKKSSFDDKSRGILITFMQHPSTKVLLEIISPNSDHSVVENLIPKFENNLYHTCYEVEDMNDYIKYLSTNGFILIDNPKPAIAFNNRKVAFLMSKFTGIIEILESHNE